MCPRPDQSSHRALPDHRAWRGGKWLAVGTRVQSSPLLDGRCAALLSFSSDFPAYSAAAGFARAPHRRPRKLPEVSNLMRGSNIEKHHLAEVLVRATDRAREIPDRTANKVNHSPKSGETCAGLPLMLPEQNSWKSSFLREAGTKTSGARGASNVDPVGKAGWFARVGLERDRQASAASRRAGAVQRHVISGRGLLSSEDQGRGRPLPDTLRSAVLAKPAAGKLVCAGVVRNQAPAARGHRHGL